MRRSLFGASVGWLGISMVADGLPALLLPYHLAARGDVDATELGLLSLVAVGTAAAIQPLAGHWSDSVGRFRVMGVGTAAAVLGLLVMLQPEAVVAGTVVALAGVSVAQAGQQALLPDLLPTRWHGRGGGLKSAFDVAGAFLAFVLLAGLLGAGNAAMAAVLLASALVLTTGLGALMVGRGTQLRQSPARAWSLAGTYRMDLAAHQALIGLIAARLLFLLGIYAVGRFLLFFVADALALPADAAAESAGLSLALLAAITVLASLPSGWAADRIGRRPLMIAGAVLAAAGIGLLPLASSADGVLAFGALMAVGTAAFSSGSWAALADVTAGREAGRLLGLAHLGTATAAAGAGAFGLVIDRAGYGVAFGVAALCTVGGGVVAAWLPAGDAQRNRVIGPVDPRP